MQQEAFGELRSALQETPSPRQFERCVDVLLCYHQQLAHETLHGVWMPYMEHHLDQHWASTDRTLAGQLATDFLLKLPELATILRGLDLSNLDLNGRQLAQLLQNHWLSDLNHLSLANNALGPMAIKPLGDATHLTHLASINLSENPIGSKGLAEFILTLDLHAIQLIDLTLTDMGPSGATQLARAQLPSLQTLHIGHNKLADAGLHALLDASWIAHIEKLSLSSNSLTSAGIEALLSHEEVFTLRSLAISKSQLDQGVVDALARASHLDKLDTLHMAEAMRRVETGCDLGVWHEAPHLATLETLNLDANTLSSDMVLAILTNPHFSNLRSLSLAKNHLYTLPRRDDLRLEQLRSLNLSSCNLDAAAIHLITQPCFEKLEALKLADNNFDSASLHKLAEAEHMAALEFLNLENNQAIDDTGFIALLGAPHLSTLKRLNVNYTSISDLSAHALLDSPLLDQLDFISLRHCQNLTDNARQMLRQAARTRPITLFV